MESDAKRKAQESLAAIGEARTSAADRLVTPWWYHPIFGAWIALYLVVISVGGSGVRMIALLAFLGGAFLLMQIYRHMTGMWISGFEAKGVAGRWALAMGLFAGVTFAGAIGIYSATSLMWPVWLMAAVVFVAMIIMGRGFDEALRRQLREMP